MSIKPIDRFAGELHETRPSFNRQCKLEMGRDSIRDAHKDAPKEHADASVEEVQEPGMLRRICTLILKFRRQVVIPLVNIGKKLFQSFVCC